ncbi:DNA-processing protein DprA [Streptacidiphilus sp. P02-A3a]|uniref:DNA-processing protein DprA n=1 Tax=Streptacidiphilus sp. P02-A3a TaxID=2704468 RepID=UPI0015FA6EF0|nr:DNA-processing protein DprA [Streptacidiphilus sp. P02-A3a]QMU67652.1 DNA-processing protein DprA [Streptacidiphilus sp. P02-A3a]
MQEHWGDERAAMVVLLRRARTERQEQEVVARVVEVGGAWRLLGKEPPSLFGGTADEELPAARAELERWAAQGIGVHTLTEPDYPQQLSSAFDAPGLVFTRGAVQPDDAGVAVVGSRQASPQALADAGAIARGLVARKLSVVSGLASGIDTAATAAALEAGGRAVGVIGTGVYHAYPPENLGLHRRVVASGLVLSPFWPDTPPSKTTFPRRNGTMSAYSLATVIVAAGPRSGTRIQARKAVEHGRPVILLRSVLNGNDWAHELLDRPDVHVAEDVDCVLGMLDDIVRRPSDVDRLLRDLVDLP